MGEYKSVHNGVVERDCGSKEVTFRECGTVKKSARQNAKGKFLPATTPPPANLNQALAAKRKVDRPRSNKPKLKPPITNFELSVTVSIGGGDVDRTLLHRRPWLGSALLSSGGTAYHLHLQMLVRVQAKSMSKLQ